jgi:UDP-glucose 4-epimerase
VAALDHLFESDAGFTVNLGTGQGYSVLDIVRAFETASGRPVPYQIAARRPGDIAVCYADPSQAKTLLRWQAQLGLADMCADHWRWQSQNPEGFKGAAR